MYEDGQAYDDPAAGNLNYEPLYTYERPVEYQQGANLYTEGDFRGTSEVKSAYRAYDSYRKPKVSTKMDWRLGFFISPQIRCFSDIFASRYISELLYSSLAYLIRESVDLSTRKLPKCL